jgi:hypothetical protein
MVVNKDPVNVLAAVGATVTGELQIYERSQKVSFF